MDGYALDKPLAWLQRKNTHAIFMLARFHETDGLSKEATTIFNRLYAEDGTVPNKYIQQQVYGPVIICDEDEDDEVADFELCDYRFLINKYIVILDLKRKPLY